MFKQIFFLSLCCLFLAAPASGQVFTLDNGSFQLCQVDMSEADRSALVKLLTNLTDDSLYKIAVRSEEGDRQYGTMNLADMKLVEVQDQNTLSRESVSEVIIISNHRCIYQACGGNGFTDAERLENGGLSPQVLANLEKLLALYQ